MRLIDANDHKQTYRRELLTPTLAPNITAQTKQTWFRSLMRLASLMNTTVEYLLLNLLNWINFEVDPICEEVYPNIKSSNHISQTNYLQMRNSTRLFRVLEKWILKVT